MHHCYLSLALLAALTVTGCSSLGLGSSSASDDGGSGITSLFDGKSKTTVNDSEIVASIKSAFKQEADLAGSNINVSSENGIVTLSGNVPNAQTYNRAISLARSAAGVRPPVRASNLNFP